MATNENVLRAILAMDSYHRNGDGMRLTEISIGNATVSQNSDQLNVTGYGFFAQSYRLGTDGPIVISYRGTDEFAWDNPDLYNGFMIAEGEPGPQALSAGQFLRSVIGQTSPFAANVEFAAQTECGKYSNIL